MHRFAFKKKKEGWKRSEGVVELLEVKISPNAN